MKVKKIFILLFGFIITLMLVIALMIVLLLNNRAKLIESQEIRYKSFVIADELRQSSDDLTQYCRLCVMTGDTTWETKYWEVLKIRNGELCRPDGHQIALHDSMQNLGFTKSEFELLSTSENYSNQLVWTEKVAFNALKGRFADSAGIFSIAAKPDIILAQRIMFDSKYLIDKQNIMQPIKQFLKAIDKRTQEQVDYYSLRGDILLAIIIILIVLVIVISIISYFLIRKKIDEEIQTEIALIESNEALKIAKVKAEDNANLIRNITDNLPAYVAVVDAQTLRYKFANLKYNTDFNKKHENIIGAHISDIIGHANAEFAMEHIDIVRDGKTSTYINSFDLVEGKRYINVTYVPAFNENGEVSEIIALSQDITERRLAENKLRESEEKFAKAFRSSPDIIVLTSLSNGLIVESNIQTEKILEYKREEIIGKSTIDLQIWVNPHERDEYIARLLRDGFVHDFDVQLRTKSGKIIDTLISGEIIELSDGKHILGTIRDITERKKSEIVLKQWKEIFQNSKWGITVGSADGKTIELMNPEFAKMHGCTVDELTGKPIYELFAPECRADIIPNIKIAHEKGHHIWESVHIRKDGSKFPVYIDITTVYDDNKEVMYRVINVQDITERKLDEEKIVESEMKFQAFMNETPVYAYIKDENLNHIYCNKKTEELLHNLNIQSKETSAKDIFDSNTASKLEKADRDILEGLKSNETIEYPFQLNNTTNWFKDIKFAMQLPNGKKVVGGLAIDITDRKNVEKVIKESEERYSSIFEKSPIGMQFYRRDGLLLNVNASCLDIFGIIDVDDIKNWNLFNDPNVTAELKEKLLQGHGVDFQVNFDFDLVKNLNLYRTTKSGIRIFDVQISALEIGFIAQIQDISERRKAEQALIESESRLQFLLDSVTDYIYSVNIEKGKVIDSKHGEGCKTVTGYSNSDFSKDKNLWINIVSAEDKDAVLEQAQNILKCIAMPLEHRIIHQNGQIRWVRNTPVMRLDIEGRLIGYDGLISDITDRKIVEEALRSSEELYRQVTTLSGYMVFDFNPDDESVKWNGDVMVVTGYTNEEFVDANYNTWKSMLHPEDKEATLHTFENAIKNDLTYHTEYRFIVKSGHIIWIEAIGFKIQSKNNSGYRVIGIMKDISERKKLEQQILTGVIETEERERLNFSQELHDGLGPLISAIKMYVQLLSMPDAKMGSKTIVEKAEGLIDEASRTVREISFKLSPHVLQNYGIVEALRAYIEKVQESKKIEIEMHNNKNCRFNDVTETIVYRVICECINNTVKHAKACLIEIDMKCNNEDLEISYKDNGRGFDVEQIQNTHKGIGLLNMKNRIKSINGSMNIDSKIGIGTTINFKVKSTQS